MSPPHNDTSSSGKLRLGQRYNLTRPKPAEVTQPGYELGFLGSLTLKRRQMVNLPYQTTALCIKHPSLSLVI